MFKQRIIKRLEKYVRKYFENHPDIKLIVIAGSVGKTSTKLAMATILSQKYRVRLHRGNHNTHLSGPLAILGIDFPGNPRNIFEWHRVFKAARQRIKAPSETEPQIIIQELGTDRPGDIEKFGNYLVPDIAVVTAITPEHMEFFGNINAVAREELTAANFSKWALINRDDIDGDFASYVTNSNISTYGSTVSAEYNFEFENFTLENGYSGKFNAVNIGKIPASVKVFGEHSMRPITAAVAVALRLGFSAEEVTEAVQYIKPVNGRMNFLRGVNDSILIDDTYNSSPAAAQAALRAFYSISAPSKIAILGSMNELGASEMVEHQKLGEMCDPLSLHWVITVGEAAEKFLAPVAKARGCQVKSFRSSIEAGAFAKKVLEKGSLVLLKGSQGGIFLEEATKMLLRSSEDYEKLVRQDEKWMKEKNRFFESLNNFEEDEV